MENQKITVLVADDHTLFRKGMAMLVRTFGGVDEVLGAANGEEALDLLKSNKVDVVLLDVDMPVLNGVDAARKIVAGYPEVKIIMVSMHKELDLISELIQIGVHSYLLKEAKPEEVSVAIRYVLNNDFYYNKIVSRALSKKSVEVPEGAAKHGVTRRETQIIQLICQELTMKEIGEKLSLSEQTVHTHRKNIMKKTNAKNTVGLVKYALQHEFVSF